MTTLLEQEVQAFKNMEFRVPVYQANSDVLKAFSLNRVSEISVAQKFGVCDNFVVIENLSAFCLSTSGYSNKKRSEPKKKNLTSPELLRVLVLSLNLLEFSLNFCIVIDSH